MYCRWWSAPIPGDPGPIPEQGPPWGHKKYSLNLRTHYPSSKMSFWNQIYDLQLVILLWLPFVLAESQLMLLPGRTHRLAAVKGTSLPGVPGVTAESASPSPGCRRCSHLSLGLNSVGWIYLCRDCNTLPVPTLNITFVPFRKSGSWRELLIVFSQLISNWILL